MPISRFYGVDSIPALRFSLLLLVHITSPSPGFSFHPTGIGISTSVSDQPRHPRPPPLTPRPKALRLQAGVVVHAPAKDVGHLFQRGGVVCGGHEEEDEDECEGAETTGWGVSWILGRGRGGMRCGVKEENTERDNTYEKRPSSLAWPQLIPKGTKSATRPEPCERIRMMYF